MATQDLERDLTSASVGYQTKDEYKRKREELEHDKAVAALLSKQGGAGAKEAKPKKKKSKMKPSSSTLSFGDDLDEEEEESAASAAPVVKKMSKCQDADTSYLALNESEIVEQSHKAEAVMREVLLQQSAARGQQVTLEYVYRSDVTQRELPAGMHHGSVTVVRGDSAEEVALAVRTDVEKLGGKFAPDTCAGVRDNREVVLIACCDGFARVGSFVLPGSMNLVELGAKRWTEGETIFEDFKHGVLVTERRWYEQNRHVYPYSHWRTYDAQQEYSLKEFVSTRNEAVDPINVRRESGAPRGK